MKLKMNHDLTEFPGVSDAEMSAIRRMKHERDLVEFDGPLLCLFVLDNEKSYLWHWCDMDEFAHRWLVMQIPHGMPLKKDEDGDLSIYGLVPDACVDDHVFIVDRHPSAWSVRKVPISQIPWGYVPNK